MTKMLIDRPVVEQALHVAMAAEHPVKLIAALRAALAEPALQTCNCRWDGEVQVQQCTLHEAHVDAIHEWAQRAKFAEKKLTALAEPVQEPVAWQWLDTAHFRKKIPADATPAHWRPLYTSPQR